MDILLGIDVGTTNIKAVAIDVQGGLIAQAARRTPTYTVGPGSEEHDPTELWQTICTVLQEVNSCLPADGKPLGLAVSSMGEAGVPVSAAGEVLYPFICWHDRRTRPQWQWWEAAFGSRETYIRAGVIPHPMYSVMKLMWLAENHPEVMAKAQRWLCVENYATWRLTGEQAISYPGACRTMCFNIVDQKWDDKMIATAKLPPDIFPTAYPSGTVVGAVTAQAAAETGLSAGLPVATGGHDHLCAALAAGAVAPEVALDSSGTTETVIIPATEPNLDERMMKAGYSYGCHVIPDLFFINTSIPAGGASLAWLAELLQISVEDIFPLAASASPGAAGVYFAPHIRGSGSPHKDPDATGLFYGLTDAVGREDFARAVVEGLCYEIAQNINFLRTHADIHLQRLRLVGGGTRYEFWNQLRADVSGLTVEIPKVTEAAACGAALLAGIGVGVYKDWQAAARLIPIDRHYIPDMEQHAEYQQRLQEVYVKLYPAMKNVEREA